MPAEEAEQEGNKVTGVNAGGGRGEKSPNEFSFNETILFSDCQRQ